MILRQNSDQRMYWTAAFTLSAVAHAIAFVAIFDLWPNGLFPEAISHITPDISVTTVMVDNAEIGADRRQAVDPSSLTATGEDPSPQTVEPATSAPEIQPVSGPDPTDPPEPERLQAIAPVETARLSPIRPDDETALLGAAPLMIAPERLTAMPVQPQDTVAMTPVVLTPLNAPAPAQTPAAPATPAPESQDPVMSQLVQKIRDRLGDPCLVAFPQRKSGGDPVVLVVADNDRVINTFADAVLNDAQAPIEHRPILVDTRQCPALNMARENPGYPSFGLSVKLRSPIVGNGGHLVGTINNIAGLYTSLLLIDDNGVVQDLRRFTSFAAGRAEFDVPVTRPGAARDTSQILMVIATQTRPKTIALRAGHLAKTFFSDLQDELGTGFLLALVPFEVR